MQERIPALSPRLAACAALVEPGATLIDVGTDHAYLPLHLLLAGQAVPPVWATDVNAGPLDRARRSAAACGAADKLIFALTDGLKGLDPACAETVVTAGMGGETIAAILSAAAPGWRRGHRFILQPMTKAPELLRALCDLGLRVTEDRLVSEGETIYRVLAAEEGEMPLPSPLTLELGPPREDPVYHAALGRLLRRLRKARAGLLAAERPDAARLAETEALLREAEAAENKIKDKG
jgi:tRNA (adenine22-N1)-methyltransferase